MSTTTKNNVDLLKTTLLFKVKAHQFQKSFQADKNFLENFNLIEEVKAGRLTQINEGIQKLQRKMSPEELADYINQKNEEGKTALFYAW